MISNSYKGVLISGGAGFLGSHLSEYFIKKDIPVFVVDNFCTSSGANIEYLLSIDKKKIFSFLKRDVIKPWAWTNEIKHPISHVFHFASPASPPLYKALSVETLLVNSQGLLNGLEYSKDIKARLVFSSTSEVYGDPAISPQPEIYWGNVNSFGERSCYDEAKRFGEALIYSFNKKFNTNNGLVRIFNTYGPRMNPSDGRVVINFLTQALGDKPLTVYGTGKQTRSFCFVSDLIDGIVKYGSSNYNFPVNLGNDKEFSILELTETIQEVFSERKLILKFEKESEDDPKQRRPNIELAKKLLAPWQPKVGLKEGLQIMTEWIRSI